MLNKDDLVLILGAGLVGSAVLARLQQANGLRLCVASRHKHGLPEWIFRQADVRSRNVVNCLFKDLRPDHVVMAAGRVGGIHANNTYPADFASDNLRMGVNVIDAAHRFKVKTVLYLGSSCIYPREAPQPMPESCLLTGPLEPTNAPYAIAKIACLMMCEAYNRQHGTRFICAMPTNVYGPGDNFDYPNCHVVPALIRRFHEAKTTGAKSIKIWGDGSARREFIFSEDLADALLFLLQHYYPTGDEMPIVNVGRGQDMQISELASKVAAVVGYKGEIIYDPSMPSGTPRKLLDISKLRDMGWCGPFRDMDSGLRIAYDSLLSSLAGSENES